MPNSTADLLARVDALALRSRVKTLAKADTVAQDRREVWARLKVESPDTADMLTTVARLFGKPERLAVKFDGDEKWVEVK